MTLITMPSATFTALEASPWTQPHARTKGCRRERAPSALRLPESLKDADPCGCARVGRLTRPGSETLTLNVPVNHLWVCAREGHSQNDLRYAAQCQITWLQCTCKVCESSRALPTRSLHGAPHSTADDALAGRHYCFALAMNCLIKPSFCITEYSAWAARRFT